MRQCLKPFIVGNGILWILGAAMEIGGWVNQSIAIMLLVIAFLWSSISLVIWIKNRGKQTKLEGLKEAKAEAKIQIGAKVKNIDPYDYYAKAESRGGSTGDFEVVLTAMISPSKSTRLDALYLEINGKRFDYQPLPDTPIQSSTHFELAFEITKEYAISTDGGLLYAEAYGKTWPSEPFPINFGGER